MSCYKSLAPHFLQESLNSIFDDNYQQKDVFLYCDGTLLAEHYAIIDSFKEKGLQVFYSDENKGLATAMNFLVDEVLKRNYKYIARMDGDDVVINNRFQKQYNYLESNQVIDVLGGWCIEIGDNGEEIFRKKLPTSHDQLMKKMIARSCVIHPTVMMRSKVFESGIRYNEQLFNMQDYELWSRLFASDFHFANLPEYILKFRFDDNFISRRKGFNRFSQELKLRYDHLRRNHLANILNMVIIFFSSISRLLPNPILKFLYKTAR